jgi:lipopolysaccharide transport system permease protein
MISPIAYTIEMVPDAMLPLIASNPIAHFIFCYQSIVFLGELPPLLSVKLIAILSPIMFLVGHYFFIRLKRVMVDYV